MAVYFYKAVQRISHNYDGYASRIWRDDLSAITIMNRFLKFDGAGIKIASMATNILIREFKIPIKDKSYIDISPDVHVRRVFTRLGLVEENSTNENLIHSARALYPEYPGVFDLPSWEVGRNWCKPTNPDCHNCFLNGFCQKSIKQRSYSPYKGTDSRISKKPDYSSIIESEKYLTEIQGTDIEKCISDFRSRIRTQMTYNGKKTFSFPGGESEYGDNYKIDTSYGILSITVIPDTGKYSRYLHFVNLNHTSTIIASDIEINIPKVSDKRIAVLLAKRGQHRYICNRGKCTVYMSSLKKDVILKHFDSKYRNVENLINNRGANPVIRFADLDSEELFEQIALFTKQMKDFKKQFRE